MLDFIRKKFKRKGRLKSDLMTSKDSDANQHELPLTTQSSLALLIPEEDCEEKSIWRFRAGWALFFAVLQIICGAAYISLGILNIFVQGSLSEIYGGIWGGAVLIACGIVGIVASRDPMHHAKIVSFLSLSMLSLLTSGVVVILTSIGLSYDEVLSTDSLLERENIFLPLFGKGYFKSSSMFVGALLLVSGTLAMIVSFSAILLCMRDACLCYGSGVIPVAASGPYLGAESLARRQRLLNWLKQQTSSIGSAKGNKIQKLQSDLSESAGTEPKATARKVQDSFAALPSAGNEKGSGLKYYDVGMQCPDDDASSVSSFCADSCCECSLSVDSIEIPSANRIAKRCAAANTYEEISANKRDVPKSPSRRMEPHFYAPALRSSSQPNLRKTISLPSNGNYLSKKKPERRNTETKDDFYSPNRLANRNAYYEVRSPDWRSREKSFYPPGTMNLMDFLPPPPPLRRDREPLSLPVILRERNSRKTRERKRSSRNRKRKRSKSRKDAKRKFKNVEPPFMILGKDGRIYDSKDPRLYEMMRPVVRYNSVDDLSYRRRSSKERMGFRNKSLECIDRYPQEMDPVRDRRRSVQDLSCLFANESRNLNPSDRLLGHRSLDALDRLFNKGKNSEIVTPQLQPLCRSGLSDLLIRSAESVYNAEEPAKISDGFRNANAIRQQANRYAKRIGSHKESPKDVQLNVGRYKPIKNEDLNPVTRKLSLKQRKEQERSIRRHLGNNEDSSTELLGEGSSASDKDRSVASYGHVSWHVSPGENAAADPTTLTRKTDPEDPYKPVAEKLYV